MKSKAGGHLKLASGGKRLCFDFSPLSTCSLPLKGHSSLVPPQLLQEGKGWARGRRDQKGASGLSNSVLEVAGREEVGLRSGCGLNEDAGSRLSVASLFPYYRKCQSSAEPGSGCWECLTTALHDCALSPHSQPVCRCPRAFSTLNRGLERLNACSHISLSAWLSTKQLIAPRGCDKLDWHANFQCLI